MQENGASVSAYSKAVTSLACSWRLFCFRVCFLPLGTSWGCTSPRRERAPTICRRSPSREVLPSQKPFQSVRKKPLRGNPRRIRERQTVRNGSFTTRVKKTKTRSEEHTSELQSRRDLVCRLLLEKKNGHISS